MRRYRETVGQPNTEIGDVIWDRYLPDSLKATTRERGEQESDSGCDMMGMEYFREIGTYLQNAISKVELSPHLSVAIAQTIFCEGTVVIPTPDEHGLGRPVPGADEFEYPLRPCNHI